MISFRAPVSAVVDLLCKASGSVLVASHCGPHGPTPHGIEGLAGLDGLIGVDVGNGLGGWMASVA